MRSLQPQQIYCKLGMSDFEVTIERCSDCRSHQWCTRHNEQNYIQAAKEMKQSIEDKFPGVKVTILKPKLKLGSFEVRCNGFLLFSKLFLKCFPNSGLLTTYIGQFIEDAKNGNSLQKYHQNARKDNIKFINRVRYGPMKQSPQSPPFIYKNTYLDVQIVICCNCAQHQWCTSHDENTYKLAAEKLERLINTQCKSPNVKISKIKDHKIGSFQVTCNNTLLYSKLALKDFPDIKLLIERIVQFEKDTCDYQNNTLTKNIFLSTETKLGTPTKSNLEQNKI